MCNKILLVCISISLLLMTNVWAQQPPSWLNLGDLPYATTIRDIIEIPGQNIILACGQSTSSYGYIWQTTNNGQSWSQRASTSLSSTTFFQLKHNVTSGRVWAVCNRDDRPIYYSDDNGTNWYYISGPPSNPSISGLTIETMSNYLYFGGSISSTYSISLYRLHPTTLQWEFVIQYPQCYQITRLKYFNNRLLVFARDRSTSAIRVFSYTASELDAMAKPVGNAIATEAKVEESEK